MKKIIDLWHGGRGLEFGYDKAMVSKNGRWEHGPGLYLTNSFFLAKKYAKGGGSTYLVTLELGNEISKVEVDLDKVIKFVNENVVAGKRDLIINDVLSSSKRCGNVGKVCVEVVMNLIFNYKAIVGKKTLELNKFIVGAGVDFGLVDNYGGSKEKVFVIYNNEKILKVKKVKSFDVRDGMYLIDVDFSRSSYCSNLKCI